VNPIMGRAPFNFDCKLIFSLYG